MAGYPTPYFETKLLFQEVHNSLIIKTTPTSPGYHFDPLRVLTL